MGFLADLLSRIIKALAAWVDRCLPTYEPGKWSNDPNEIRPVWSCSSQSSRHSVDSAPCSKRRGPASSGPLDGLEAEQLV